MTLDRDQIMQVLPHRPPFLLVDEVVELDPGARCIATRTLRDEDFWFAGHFPGNPVMPGVLIVEALAQTATLAAASAGGSEGRIGLFAGIDKVRFKRVVKPGDTLHMEAEIVAVHGPVGRAKVVAKVEGQLACRGELMFAIVDAASIAAGEAKL
jgi:3-hydroxyacyl-[acyl-carrier-protein] dehydratase